MDESETVSVPHDERRRSFASYRVPLDGRSSPTSQTTPTAPFGKDVSHLFKIGNESINFSLE